MISKLVPNLWFDGCAEEAVAFYTSVFPDSRVVRTLRYPEGAPGEAGTPMTVEFELRGERFVAINAGPEFRFTEAVSFSVDCADQAEVDHYWDLLLSDGGEAGPCGWLKDRFGLSWQVAPRGMDDLFEGDPESAARVFAAMERMSKLDVAALQAAADGPAPS